MKKIFYAFFILVLASCSSKAETLDGTYVLQDAPEGGVFTLILENGHYSGKSGVNNYFGSYTSEGEKIHFEAGGSTMMMGPQNLMEAEKAYLGALFKTTSFHFENKNLVLSIDGATSLTYKKQ